MSYSHETTLYTTHCMCVFMFLLSVLKKNLNLKAGVFKVFDLIKLNPFQYPISKDFTIRSLHGI